MKNRIPITYICAMALMVLSSVATLYTLYARITAIHYISYAFDPQLSLSVRSLIERQVALCEYESGYQSHAIMQELLRLFPDIEQIDIRSLPYNMAEITITTPEPVAKINNTHILTHHRTIIPVTFYADFVSEHLPKLEVEVVPKTISAEMMTALKHSIKERIFDHFIVNLHDDHEWHLYDKKDPLFTICCNGESVPSEKVRSVCARLKETIKKNYSPKTAWMADIRFGHQIVLSRYKGGRNGKRI